MSTVLGIPVPVILGQLTLGLVNGSFYALLSLGLAVIFGLMGVVNFAHGAPGGVRTATSGRADTDP